MASKASIRAAADAAALAAQGTAGTKAAAAEDDKKEPEGKPNPDSNADMRAAMQKQVDAADAHKQKARDVQDTAASFKGDPDDETKAAANTMRASVKAAHAEGNRALAACSSMMGGDDDEGDDDDTAARAAAAADPVAAAIAKTNVAATSADYIAAFGDKGARWFIESKPFGLACVEYIDGLKAAHTTEVAAKDAVIAARDTTIADLNTKLDAVKAGWATTPPRSRPPTSQATSANPRRLARSRRPTASTPTARRSARPAASAGSPTVSTCPPSGRPTSEPPATG